MADKSLMERYMERCRKEHQRRRNQMTMILKITVIALAVAILATGVISGVTFFTDGFSSADETESDGNGGAPSITGPAEGYVIIYIGDKPSYKSFVKTTGKGELKVEHNVNPDQEGTYTVHYTFGDLTYDLTVYVIPRTFTEEQRKELNTRIANIVEQQGWRSLSKIQQVQAVYQYVKSYVPWKSSSPSNLDTIREDFKRETWKLDWEEEAFLTLNTKKGDCYSYYSLSKAFFECLGIENLGVRRASSIKEDGTHFWNIVNVGTGWYYYDATELGGHFEVGNRGDNGCLLTQAELDSYITGDGRIDNEFYKLDQSQWEREFSREFPTIATAKIPVS